MNKYSFIRKPAIRLSQLKVLKNCLLLQTLTHLLGGMDFIYNINKIRTFAYFRVKITLIVCALLTYLLKVNSYSPSKY